MYTANSSIYCITFTCEQIYIFENRQYKSIQIRRDITERTILYSLKNIVNLAFSDVSFGLNKELEGIISVLKVNLQFFCVLNLSKQLQINAVFFTKAIKCMAQITSYKRVIFTKT